jgi:hypothetical protein
MAKKVYGKRPGRATLPPCQPPSPIQLTAPSRPQREIVVSDDDLESCRFPSHQVELPAFFVQDSSASLLSLDLEPIPQRFFLEDRLPPSTAPPPPQLVVLSFFTRCKKVLDWDQ